MIYIREHLAQDIPLRVKWLNNPKVNQYIGDIPGQGTTLEKQQKWFMEYEKDETKQFFTICEEETPIGIIGLSNINKINQNADLFIVIGEDAYRGKGFGKKALQWILDFAFQDLCLHKVNLGVFEENTTAIRLYTSLGFETEGRMKNEIYFDGTFHNFLSMAIFRKP